MGARAKAGGARRRESGARARVRGQGPRLQLAGRRLGRGAGRGYIGAAGRAAGGARGCPAARAGPKGGPWNQVFNRRILKAWRERAAAPLRRSAGRGRTRPGLAAAAPAPRKTGRAPLAAGPCGAAGPRRVSGGRRGPGRARAAPGNSPLRFGRGGGRWRVRGRGPQAFFSSGRKRALAWSRPYDSPDCQPNALLPPALPKRSCGSKRTPQTDDHPPEPLSSG